jgi:hypothetical protein
LRRKLRRVRAFESFKRKQEAQVVVQKEIERSNSPRRTPEIARTIGSRKVAGKLSVGQTHLRKAGVNVDH